ncbi:ParB family chromosome partitioning protein [Bradyrhizobium diazoefficiens]|jgi:ParB family chromosome partitioning protein|nr:MULTISPECIES: plasmid partitioning protein RepB [Bradyrhizobium]MBR0867715.1 plasmid partitioning protein RepB [Bradyrhizobium diazoefficiens]MBR0892890.1 plasmid partitioning protein RepB [Bradyrhizobium diazoefficiens]MBR0924593.1 plasmid partitioning protein RepB [Bradyrhizobium diazoefficiens]BAP81983.1 plasmid partitioning protein RepB [Bradyrhizobium diazoefficiens]
MARKNPFANILDDQRPAVDDVAADHKRPSRPVSDYAAKGASRSLLKSLDELAARADKLVEGETVVELEPDLIDASFVRDRRADDEAEFNQLLERIRERGQDSPILVRPNPKSAGRYMVVFGHRRWKVAQALGRKVRAVVKDIEDREHVLALGHENAARADVPFIDRALFAADVVRLRYDDDNAIILSALSIDRTTLSKMLSVAGLPSPILEAIGQAKNVGRDRWYELKLLLDSPAIQERALQTIRDEAFSRLSSDARFDFLVRKLRSKPTRKQNQPSRRNWTPPDSALSAEISAEGKKFTLALKAKTSDARAFGEYLSENLDQLYEAFRRGSIPQETGD